MPSVQRYLSGRNNLVREAILAASSVRPSTAIERTSARRTGGGRVRLGGAYTGHEAAGIDVEIVAAGGIPRASVPQFVGVGNGQLSVLDVDAAALLQAITLTLADLGIPTEHARLDVRELQIRARAPGDAGNLIRITVQPALTRLPTEWALLADWSTGTAVQTGNQWDFGGLPLSTQGALDPDSPRIAFGFDPQVYRPYRQYKDGAWQFGLSPALERTVPKGTAVHLVTGGYVVTVTDGVTTETYGDVDDGQSEIVTFYDLLSALQASALVEVAGVVAADRTIAGQAAIDVPLRTQAWLFALSGKVALQDVAVPPLAPTQSLTVRCINADAVGAERWSVTGDVSGTLPVAHTGVPYATAAAEFVIPVIAPATQDSGEWSFKYQPATREDGEGIPSVCVRPFRFGANAKARTVTFVYQQRPPADCSCADMPTPRLSLHCLGLGEDMDVDDPEYMARLTAVYAWREGFVRGNTAIFTEPVVIDDFGETAQPPIYQARRIDIDWMGRAIAILLDCLGQVSASPAALALWDDLWVEVQADLAHIAGMDSNLDNSTTYAANAIVSRNAMPGYLDRYRATVDNILLAAGILPKSDSSSSDAGGCWIDHGGTHWWVDQDGYYLPAFSNQPYISARRDTETGKAYSTQEFGFGLVVACEERLREGDTLTIRIQQVDGERPYQVGDEAVIQTIAAGPAWLAGGVDGTDVQTWRVSGSTSGALPDYVVPTDGPAAPVWASTAAGIELQMALGGIPFSLGDQFTLAVEAGQYRWRRDGAAWSALADIPAAGQAGLVDGLSVHFDAGAAPSFVPGDAYAFAVHQPWAVSHVRSAAATAWGWDGDSATLVIDLGSVQALHAIALARYQLPAGAVVTWAASDDGVAYSPAQPLHVSRTVCVQFAQASARYVRISVSNAPGGSIGWIWAGIPFATDHHASTCQRNRRWAVGRGNGLNPAGLYAGAGDGWTLGWSPDDWAASRLLEQDMQGLLPLLDWAQQTDEPLLFAPHHLHPQDACLVRFAAEALEVTDTNEYQANDADHRYLRASLELEPVYA